MFRWFVLVGAVVILFTTACTPRPQIVKRYKTVKHVKPDQISVQLPDLTFTSLPIEKASGNKTVFDLSDRGQAALLSSLGNKVDKPGAYLVAVGSKLGPRRSRPQDVDLTKFEKRVIFTVERGSRKPADRLDWYKIKFNIVSKDLKFTNWNKAETKYEQIELGKLSLVQQNIGNLSGSLAPAPISRVSALGFEVSSQKTLTESQDLRRRIVDLNVAVPKSDAAVVVRHGASDRDLDGNTIVDFNLAYTGVTDTKILHVFSNLSGSGQNLKKPSEIQLITYDSKYPLRASDLFATALMEYDLRHVESGDDTINEGDDNVQILSHKTAMQGPAVVVSVDDQKLTVQRMGLPGTAFQSLESILVYEPDAVPACREPDNRQLRFREYWEAQTFYDWLERSLKAGTFTNKVVVTQFKFVLCLWNLSTNKKAALKPSQIQQLWIYPYDLN